MNKILLKIFILLIIGLLSASAKGQVYYPLKVNIILIENNDTTALSNNAVLKFCYEKDTFSLPIVNQKVQLDSSVNLKLSKLILVDSISEFKMFTTHGNTFESVFKFDKSDGTMKIEYFDNYKIAKKSYGEYITIKPEEFKSVTIWNYEWHFHDYFNLETK